KVGCAHQVFLIAYGMLSFGTDESNIGPPDVIFGRRLKSIFRIHLTLISRQTRQHSPYPTLSSLVSSFRIRHKDGLAVTKLIVSSRRVGELEELLNRHQSRWSAHTNPSIDSSTDARDVCIPSEVQLYAELNVPRAAALVEIAEASIESLSQTELLEALDGGDVEARRLPAVEIRRQRNREEVGWQNPGGILVAVDHRVDLVQQRRTCRSRCLRLIIRRRPGIVIRRRERGRTGGAHEVRAARTRIVRENAEHRVIENVQTIGAELQPALTFAEPPALLHREVENLRPRSTNAVQRARRGADAPKRRARERRRVRVRLALRTDRA